MEKCREADIKKLLSENAAAVETELEKYLKRPMRRSKRSIHPCATVRSAEESAYAPFS